MPVGYLRELAEYWRTAYDWRKHEARLNQLPQFITTIDGPDRALPARPLPRAGCDAAAAASTAGPGSVVEFLDVVGPLSDPAAHGGDPADAFHLVIPSLPGLGFSGPLAEPGWSHGRIAGAFVELMARLGYDRYGVQGGDVGAFVAPEMGRQAPGHVVGVHVNALVTFPSGDPAELADLTEAEQQRLARMQHFQEEMMGYSHIQATRPQTLAYGLTDSPVGPARLDRREVQGVDRPGGRAARGRRRPRPPADQRQRLLVHGHRRLVGQPLLRDGPRPERVGAAGSAARCRPGWPCP